MCTEEVLSVDACVALRTNPSIARAHVAFNITQDGRAPTRRDECQRRGETQAQARTTPSWGQNEGEPMSQERQHEGLPYDKCMSRARLWRRSHRDVAFASYSAPALSTGNGVFKLVQSAASAQPERGMVAPSNRALGPPRMTSPQAIPGGGDRANMAGEKAQLSAKEGPVDSCRNDRQVRLRTCAPAELNWWNNSYWLKGACPGLVIYAAG
ncbi:hypothetical protein ACCO45_011070 [Purpureocillium lilacinum]|uniref:Uncharacterized protein n=1 Tax=Purpureocillium lilacinum TaxID=33203 RepID=A0ACC4DGL6_PURLI